MLQVGAGRRKCKEASEIHILSTWRSRQFLSHIFLGVTIQWAAFKMVLVNKTQGLSGYKEHLFLIDVLSNPGPVWVEVRF